MPLENVDVAAPEGFYEELGTKALVPGWAKREPAMWSEPRPKFVPVVWRYKEAREALDKAADFVSPEKAERRNLILVAPIEGNNYPTCRHLVAAYQLVLPGETARSHRHAPNALRIVLDVGPETYTIVDGTRVDVAEGDVVLTPSWAWHGHSNFSSEPAFWIDILDVPLVQNLENMYFEDYPTKNEQISSNQPDSELRNKDADILAATREQGRAPIAQGMIKTMGIHSLGLNEGETYEQGRRITNSIYTVMRGEVDMEIENLGQVTVTRGDVVVIPNWHAYSIRARREFSQLIQVTDEPVFDALGFTELEKTQA
ncbi:cupin domain-containing protein [Mesorhizobium sp. KR2-14]|uniref:cupin domain-containing protein n=1 Tax=Mesorhizobium sp. KR2-14 TaxID=3156610 RepID=UPI0032B52687